MSASVRIRLARIEGRGRGGRLATPYGLAAAVAAEAGLPPVDAAAVAAAYAATGEPATVAAFFAWLNTETPQ